MKVSCSLRGGLPIYNKCIMRVHLAAQLLFVYEASLVRAHVTIPTCMHQNSSRRCSHAEPRVPIPRGALYCSFLASYIRIKMKYIPLHYRSFCGVADLRQIE